MPWTYEKAYPILRSIALGFVRKNGWYEVNELVNEVWLKGKVQRSGSPKHLVQVAYCDMMDYMRTQDGRRWGDRRSKLRKAKSLDSVNLEFNDGESYGAFLGKEDENFDLTDNKEQLKVLMAPLSRAQKLAVIMYYAHNFKNKEIGHVAGLDASRITQLRKEALILMRDRAHELDIRYGRILCETSPKE